MAESIQSGESPFANRPDYEFFRAFQRQLMELRQQFITLLGKTIFSPDEIEALTNMLAPILFTMKDVLPNDEAIEKFWEYWKEPDKFIKNHPADFNYIIYYRKGNEILMSPAKDDAELRKKEKELTMRQYKILQVKIVLTPELLKRLVEIVLETASEAGIISLKVPLMNRPILYDDKEIARLIKKLNKKIRGW